MGTFRPLFAIAVEHSYFADGKWCGLRFVPTAEVRKIVEIGAVVRPTGKGVLVLVEEERLAALRLMTRGDPPQLSFSFKVYATDRAFGNYTALSLRKENEILCLSNQNPQAAEQQRRLTAGPFAGSADFVSLDSLVGDGVLDEQDRKLLPDFVVSVAVDTESAEEATAVPEFVAAFEARSSYWKYNLLGNMNRKDAFIVDLDNRVTFESCGEVALAENHRMARVFRTTQRIALTEKPNYRFQLRETNQNGSKVLVKRLPVAAGARLGHEVIDGKNEVVMENYVNY